MIILFPIDCKKLTLVPSWLMMVLGSCGSDEFSLFSVSCIEDESGCDDDDSRYDGNDNEDDATAQVLHDVCSDDGGNSVDGEKAVTSQ
mmetsp:Transcript_41836/g.75362  ORF Transcript_41836/g.75362 Transcript_41836/m.75362 type:complete len:88 (-) Transcript_41836:154-417(-)